MSVYPYIRIACAFKYDILSGIYQPGQQLPSIRLIAKQENRNSATVCHALKILAQQGLIFKRCSKGYFVIDDPLRIATLRRKECIRLTNDFMDRLHSFGYSNMEIYMLLQKHCKNSNNTL